MHDTCCVAICNSCATLSTPQTGVQQNGRRSNTLHGWSCNTNSQDGRKETCRARERAAPWRARSLPVESDLGVRSHPAWAPIIHNMPASLRSIYRMPAQEENDCSWIVPAMQGSCGYVLAESHTRSGL
eukprot:365758-Chlamydomonas_euryale.AAC.15